MTQKNLNASPPSDDKRSSQYWGTRPTPMTGYKSLLVGLTLALTAACSLFTEPLGYDLPDPDPSLDQAALVAPRLLFACGEWLNGPRPEDEKILVDVSFVWNYLDDPADRPTSTQLAALKRHGGQVLYTFSFPAVRALVATSEISALDDEIAIEALFRVANPRRYDWKAGVGYRRPYSYQDGAIKYEELGGRVDFRFDAINAISGLLPDRSAAVLRQDRNVDHVESAASIPNCF